MSSRHTTVPLRVTEVIDYAVKAAVLLGAHEGEFLSSVEIADHFGMSPKMLGQVLRALGAAGILVARQGWHGGFRLARPAGTIPLRAVVSAVGSGGFPTGSGDFATGSAGDAGNGHAQRQTAAEAVDRFWQALDSQVQQTLESVTIQDLLPEIASGPSEVLEVSNPSAR